ncbi:MAG: hypothetical protein HC890_03525 [Chloroflexaceae bacterium]|nr:hypothetical protein [Chloroflexaceae bacterium]
MSQPFFTTKPNGNGLGLAIAQQILETCGGQLVIESTLAAGTTVSVGLLVTGC